MNTSDFDYHLPAELIAQSPVEPRDHSQLMVLDRQKKKMTQHHFFDLSNFLQSGDLLVWNNSKVFKARLQGKIFSDTGDALREHARSVEIFLVRPMENAGVWKVLAKPGRHLSLGMRVQFAPSTSSGQADFFCDVIAKEEGGVILVQFSENEDLVRAKANQYGQIPIPPYVKKIPNELSAYQTVYAKTEGSVAAPTAGFHFTPELIERLKQKGVEFAEVTLHVGLGTFLPVKTEQVEAHTMHSEWVELTEDNAEKINRAKKEGRRVIAVGTTTVRTLEGIAQLHRSAKIQPYRGEINIFITPGFRFQIVDAMITNFHLPKSTLLMLVCAFVGDRQFTLGCYQKAVEEKYRFFSFGDAMFIA